ncbi:MAG TPA: hypothetical protein VJX70_14460 [Candidatus Acidoferrum sp.]|nr:hypothetical protein [Candidatus Acidoferrum sp.]
MRRLIVSLVSAVTLLVLAATVHAQDLLVPAGTLLQCTMEEPNFSSATASVGDPVLCHLKSFQEFGRTVFPRGSMLAGHLEADKEPGHFVGKGYLKISFDRVIVPTGDVPLPAKVIAAKGYKVDKQGDIKGNGHATRDVVEWMIPPLWPWKVVSLPARGPRPTIKGEEPLQLRLMDDIVVPRNLSASLAMPRNLSGSAFHPDRPPYASPNIPKPTSLVGASPANAIQQAMLEAKPAEGAKENIVQVAMSVSEPAPPVAAEATVRMTLLVLKSNQVLEVTKYRMDGGLVNYHELGGSEGSVDAEQIDWRKTTQMTSEVRSVDLPVMARQTN